MESIVIAFLSGVIGPVAVIIAKYFLDKRAKKDPIIECLEIGDLVTKKIDDILEEFNADRVWITQFHNGGHFYPTGKSVAKFSIIYETVSPGTNSVQNNFKNIPVNLFAKSMNRLLDSNNIEIADYKDESIPTYGLKYIAEETGCKSSYLFALKSIDGKFIGVLGVEFVKRKYKISPADVALLENQASALGGVLMTHLK